MAQHPDRWDPRRRQPPEATLRWAAQQVGPGSRVVACWRMTRGGWHANHALVVTDRLGRGHRLVLRRWARPEWRTEDPDLTAEREAGVLTLLEDSDLPVPRLVGADLDATVCDVPTLLITRLPGHPPGLPPDMDGFVEALAATHAGVAAVSDSARGRVPAYRRYHDRMAVPGWSRLRPMWEAAVAIAASEPPAGPRGFLHRDYHPENTLWSRGRLTGVVDWTTGSWGPLAVDRGHMRWNLAVTYGLDVADAFLSRCGGPSADQPYWDIVTALDVVTDLDPSEWARLDLARLERHVARAVRAIGR